MSKYLIERALMHIASIHPSVTQVVYGDDLRWCYSDANGSAVTFGKTEDIGLLEDAADEAFDRTLQNVVIKLPARSMTELRGLWNELADVPTADECLDEAFLHFETGTELVDVWQWFEAQNPAFVVGEAGRSIGDDHPFAAMP
ncbi:hypothetical protein RYA05_04240 [Pseudomonas syringae pv. actinidiae]|nr:hypothetical protein [Pseudomonas syringae pv. actinidiae]